MTGYEGYDQIPSAFDAISQRRGSFGAQPSTLSFSAPGGYESGNAGPSGAASANDPGYDYMRQQAMSDSVGRTQGMRQTAMDSSPNDPSAAAFGGLEGEFGGQDRAAHDMNAAAMQHYQTMQMQAWQQHMAELQHQWDMEQQRSANTAALWGMGGQLLGAGISAFPSYAKTFGWGGAKP